MVSSILSLTKNGVKDFFWQRVSAIILAIYLIFIGCFVLAHTPFTYLDWSQLFSNVFMKWFSMLALIALIKHAWVGMWTIFTDYIHCSWLRAILMVLVLILFLIYIIWGFQILWSV